MPALAKTLVVVSFYDARPRQDLDALLQDLATVPAEAPFDVLVVVNQTQPTATAIASPLPNLRVLHRPNTGYNIGAWDHGYRAAPGYSNYLFLQDECRLRRPGWLRPFVRRLLRPEVGLVGERMNPAWAASWAEIARKFAGHTLEGHQVLGAPADRLPTYRHFWARHGIALGERGDHLQTLVLAARGEVLARTDGFLLGGDYGEAIAAEIAISKRVQALGLLVEEIGPRPFTWITHAQWQGKAETQPLRAPRLGLSAWLETVRATKQFDGKPWLVLGKGPTFAECTDAQRAAHHTFGLNHVVREQPVTIAHAIDVDVVVACREVLAANCQYLLMPRVPHVGSVAGERLLEEWFLEIPELYELEVQGRLVWYACSTATGRTFQGSPRIEVQFFSSEAAFQILAAMGVRTIRSLGIDGGTRYSGTFADLAGSTRLQNGQPLFDRQFARIAAIVRQHGIDYAPLAKPLELTIVQRAHEELVAAVLEHTLRCSTSFPLAITRVSDPTQAPAGTAIVPARALAIADIATALRSGTSTASCVHEFVARRPWHDPTTTDVHGRAWLDTFAEMVSVGLVAPALVRRAVRSGHADARLLMLPIPAVPTVGDAVAMAEQRVRSLRYELANLRLSRTWQVGRWLTTPLRLISQNGSGRA